MPRTGRGLLRNTPELLIEGALLGAFMLSASCFAALLEHPSSVVRGALQSGEVRRALMGVAMGLTAVGLIYSPWGKRSGAHMNPAVTLAFYSLGKVERRDAIAYAVAQVVGGALGMALACALLGDAISAPEVSYVLTLPGTYGVAGAFATEVAISFSLLFAVLIAANHPVGAKYAGMVAGTVLALEIYLAGPISGTSLNPARSLASALLAGRFEHLWIYFMAPPLGMLAAGALYRRLMGARAVHCAKVQHVGAVSCIFRCTFHQLVTQKSGLASEDAAHRSGASGH